MKIKEGLKIRDIAGERVVIMQGRAGMDLTRLISLNQTAEWLWEQLLGRDFTVADAARALQEQYAIEAGRAEADARAWIEKLTGCGAIVE